MDNHVNENANNSTRLRQSFSRVGYWLKRPLALIGIVMPLAYIGVAGFVLLSERMKEIMQPTNRYVLSGLLIIYGIFRIYRLLKTQKVEDENQ